jgi:hypothetical protein
LFGLLLFDDVWLSIYLLLCSVRGAVPILITFWTHVLLTDNAPRSVVGFVQVCRREAL